MSAESSTKPHKKGSAPKSNTGELLGAHVSIQGGTPTAPARGREIGATALQIFTKTPNMWREPEITPQIALEFQQALAENPVGAVVSHDSYLINLASPDPNLRQKSTLAFQNELRRSASLKLTGVVSHPGNYIDDHDAGIERNAAAITEALRAVPGDIRVFLETTAGTGTALGRSFEELAAIRELVEDDVRHRIAFCADTCHMYSAGYDLAGDFDGVWQVWDEVIGMALLGCLHLNDSKHPFGAHKDRHELIGAGSLGEEPFRRIMTDPRFGSIPKLLETPKGDDTGNDLRMLELLRGYASSER